MFDTTTLYIAIGTTFVFTLLITIIIALLCQKAKINKLNDQFAEDIAIIKADNKHEIEKIKTNYEKKLDELRKELEEEKNKTISSRAKELKDEIKDKTKDVFNSDNFKSTISNTKTVAIKTTKLILAKNIDSFSKFIVKKAPNVVKKLLK